MALMNPRAAEVADNIIRQLVDKVGKENWGALDGEHRELVEQCAADAGVLLVSSMTIPPDDKAAQLSLLREKAQLKSQLLNVASAEANAVASAFWDVVKTILNGAVAVAFAAV